MLGLQSDNLCHCNHVACFLFWFHSATFVGVTGRLKVEIPLSAITESRPKVTYHIRPKPYVPPKVKRDFRPKTETESQSWDDKTIEASKSCPAVLF